MNEQRMSPEGVSGDGATSIDGHAMPVSTVGLEDTEQPPEQARRARRSSFAQMLVDSGVLSEENVDNAHEAAQRERLPLGQVLVRDGLVLSRDLATLTALHLGLPMVDLRNETVEPEAVMLLPVDIARRYLVLAVRQTGNRLTVAMTDPTDLQAIQDLTTRTGCTIDPVIATPDDIQENIDLSYRAIERQAATALTEDGAARPTADALRNSQPAEIVQTLLVQTLQDRASETRNAEWRSSAPGLYDVGVDDLVVEPLLAPVPYDHQVAEKDKGR